ncbi:hypothetical protein ACVITL_001822 [Rhizobium pisi]
MITSNLPFDEWTETLGSECLTGALLGRITHHVNILEMNRDSYRLVKPRHERPADTRRKTQRADDPPGEAKPSRRDHPRAVSTIVAAIGRPPQLT